MKQNLHFVKVGGSVLTDKSKKFTYLQQQAQQVAQELVELQKNDPEALLIIGNGAGSFGHYLAKKYASGTQNRFATEHANEIHQAVADLNERFTGELQKAGLRPRSFAAASFLTADGDELNCEGTSLNDTLQAGHSPCVYGDLVPVSDSLWRVVPTEDIFLALANSLSSQYTLGSCLLLTDVDGVLDNGNKLLRTFSNTQVLANKTTDARFDVTGAMAGKLRGALKLADYFAEVRIANGTRKGVIQDIMRGHDVGTRIIK